MKCTFWDSHVETVRRSSLVTLAVRLGLAVTEGGELSLGGDGGLREVYFLGQSC